MNLPSLSVLSISLLLVYTSQAFTINTPSSPIPTTCSKSCLFRTAVVSSPTCKLNQKQLRMTSSSSSNDNKDEEAETSSTEIVENKSDVGNKKSIATNSEAVDNRSALFNALVIGPPLIAKFGVVILVKIATDLVVFPLLFLYRFCNMMKKKVVGLFRPKEELLNGEKINGTS